MKSLKIRKYLDFVIIISVSVFFCRGLLFTPGLPMGSDALSWVHVQKFNAMHSWWFPTWLGISFPGEPTRVSPLDVFFTFLLTVFQDTIGVKVIIFLTYLVAGLGMYIFMHYYCGIRNIALLSALAYMLNRPVVDQFLQGHYYISFGYALLPLLFLTWDKTLRTGEFKDILLSTIILSVFATSSHPTYIYMAFAFLIAFIIYNALAIVMSAPIKKIIIRRFLKIFALSWASFIPLSAFTVVPFMLGAAPTYTYQSFDHLIRSVYKYSSKSLLDAIIMSNIEATFPPLWTAGMFCIPILSYLAFFFRRDRYTTFFIISAIISTFLSKGPYPPFSEIFLWLFYNVPAFSSLRVAARWLLITAFSYSFLAGVSINAIYDHVENIRKKAFKRHVHTSPLKRMVYHIPTLIFIALIGVSLFTPSWLGFYHGLQTYNPPEIYVRPHEWIEQQPGDILVLTLPFTGTGWMYIPWQPGFWSWTWDFGTYSPNIHRKTLIVGTQRLWTPYAVNFLDFINHIVRNNRTNNLMKILGALNVKFVVFQSYAPTSEREFFNNQHGLKMVYQYGNASVLENLYWIPRIFASSRYAFVLGGYGTFTSLSTVESLDFSRWPLLFAHQNNENFHSLLKKSDIIVFSDSSFMDLVMLSLKVRGNAYVIDATSHAGKNYDSTSSWVSGNQFTCEGLFVLNRFDHYIYTYGNVSIDIPFNIESSGKYDAWIRVFHYTQADLLHILIDDKPVRGVRPTLSPYYGFKWVKIGNATLSQGQHVLRLTNVNLGGLGNYVDQIAIVKPSLLNLEMDYVGDLIKSSDSRIVYVLEQNRFSGRSWFPHRYNYNASDGLLLRHVDDGSAPDISGDIYIPKDGRYMVAVRVVVGPDYGDLKVLVNGNPYFINCSTPSSELKWYEIGPISLNASNTTITISGNGELAFDEMIIYSLKEGENRVPLSSIFKYDPFFSVQSVSCIKIDPTKYIARIKAEEPFYLVFSDTYHPLWRAYVDGKETSSVPVYSFINGFYINKTGKFEVTIEFTGQRYAYIGVGISSLSWLAALVYLGLRWTKRWKLSIFKKSLEIS